MSADISNDVSRIRDEDVLRKMWQETEDFGRKKEIRAHMYKLREQRLREFYNNGDVTSEIRTTIETNGKPRNTPTHADSLVDHSFMSLKDKEIRDSESPTREMSYKVTDKHDDHGWQISSSKEISGDGKTQTSALLATTAGVRKIDGGKIDYAAKNEQIDRIYQDGDDRNFIKSSGTQSNTMIKQEAVGGDENSNFRTSSSKTSSSSRVVSEQKSSFHDVPADFDDSATTITRKVYTSDVPSELKDHSNYVEGKTKVTRETRTLPDGTVVTTTRYETKGGNTDHSSTKYSSDVRSSTEQSSSKKSTGIHTSRITGDHKVRENVSATTNIHEFEDDVNRSYQNIRSTDKDTKSKTSHTKNQRGFNEQRENRVVKNNYSVEDKSNQNLKFEDSLSDTQTLVNISVIKSNKDESSSQRIRENTNVTNEKTSKQVDSDIVDINTDDTIRRERIPVPLKNKKDIDLTVRNAETRKQDISHEVTSKTMRSTDEKVISDQFIDSECRNELKTRQIIDEKPRERSPTKAIEGTVLERYTSETHTKAKHPKKVEKKVVKTESDQTTETTEGRYETTYKSDYTNRKISVEVSPTHDAFARSLRAVSPERVPSRGSQISLRSSTSPDNTKQPSRYSPERQPRDRSYSPKKSTDRFSRTETITRNSARKSSPKRTVTTEITSSSRDSTVRNAKENTYGRNTSEPISPRKKSTVDTKTKKEIDTSTLTRRKPAVRSRSPSPAFTITSEIEYFTNVSDMVTDLDEEVITKTGSISKQDKRPTTLEITKKTRKITERSPTSPLTDLVSPKKSPNKEAVRRNSLRSPTKEPSPDKPSKYSPREDRPLVRTDTYEERCRQILGITENTERRRSSLEKSSLKRDSLTTTDDISSTRIEKHRKISRSPDKSPVKQGDNPVETSTTKHETLKNIPDNRPRSGSPSKSTTTTSKHVVSQTNTKLPSNKPHSREHSPKKQVALTELTEHDSARKYSLEMLNHEKSTVREPVKHVQRHTEQARTDERPQKQSPEKEGPTKDTPSEPYPDKENPRNTGRKPSELPTRIEKSPTRQPLQHFPDERIPVRETPKISEYPSQVEKSTVKEPSEPYPAKKSPMKEAPKITEYPSQIEKSTVKVPLATYPERKSPTKEAPKIAEYPSQVKKYIVKEPSEPYPKKESPTKEAPRISEYPSQVKKTIVKEHMEPYPKKESPTKEAPKIAEYPSQVKKSIVKEPLEPYPKKESPTKEAPRIAEYPSQVKKTIVKEPMEPYPKKESPTKEAPKIAEYPSQVRKSSVKEPLEPYPKKESTTEEAPKIAEYPSQVKKTIVKKPMEPYPKREGPTKEAPKIAEYPSQVRKSSVKEPLEPYPKKESPTKDAPKINEYPSQVKKPIVKEPVEPYPEKESPTKEAPKIAEYPSQVRKPIVREPSEPYTKKESPTKEAPKINEYPSQVKKSIMKEPLEQHPKKESPTKVAPKIDEYPSQVKKSIVKEPLEPYPKKESPTKEAPKIAEYPSQVKKPIVKEPMELYPKRESPTKEAPKIAEYPSQIKKSIVKEPLESYPKRESPTKEVKPKDKSHPADSSSEDDEEVEKIFAQQHVAYLENKIPVDEPIVTKKFLSQLCRDDETERHDVTEVNIQKVRNDKVSQIPNIQKPQSKKIATKNFIEKERNTSHTSNIEKRPHTKQSDKKADTYSTKVEKTEIDRINTNNTDRSTEYTDKYCKLNGKEIPKTTVKKPTKPVASPGVKSHVEKVPVKTKITTKTISVKSEMNGNTGKKPKPKDLTKTPSGIVKSTIILQPSNKKPSSQKPGDQQQITTTSRYITTVKKSVKAPDQIIKPKAVVSHLSNKSTINVEKTSHTTQVAPYPSDELPRKNKSVITTITLRASAKPGSDKSNLRNTITTTKGKKIVKTSTSRPRKPSDMQILSDTEDDQSIIDSLEGSMIDITNNVDISETEVIDRISTTHSRSRQEHPEINKVGRKYEKKCITTKTVMINNNESQNRDIIVDLQRSKSSREPTPDRLCPVPLSSDDEFAEIPRYPDEVVEPDDSAFRRKPNRLSDIPISESEDINEFSRITDITDNKVITDVDRVEETDDSLLSVNKKISKFTHTTKNINRRCEKLGPAPKVARQKLDVTEDLESDDCLLSVSDKVTKFISTAEDLITHKQPQSRPKSPKCRYYPDDRVESNKPPDNVTHYSRSTKNETKLITGTTAVFDDGEVIPEDDYAKSVSDKVSKFISTADKLTSNKEPVSLARIEIKPKADKSPERKSPTKFVPDTNKEDQATIRKPFTPYRVNPETTTEQGSIRTIERTENLEADKQTIISRATVEKKLHSEKIQNPTGERKQSPGRKSPTKSIPCEAEYSPTRKPITPFVPEENHPKTTERRSPTKYVSANRVQVHSEDRSTRNESSPDRNESTPSRRPSNEYHSIKKSKDQDAKYPRRGSEPSDSTPRSTRKPSREEAKPVLSSTGRMRSTESIKKAKAVFENISSREQISKQNGVLKQSLPERRTPVDDSVASTKRRLSRKKLNYDDGDEEATLKTEPISRETPSRSNSPRKEGPRSHSPGGIRDSSPANGDIPHYMRPLDRNFRPDSPDREVPTRTETNDLKTTFGVTLKKTDSGRAVTHTTSTTTPSSRKEFPRSSSPEKSRLHDTDASDIPHYMLPLDRTQRPESPHEEMPQYSHDEFSRSSSPEKSRIHGTSTDDGDIPHYMLPLDRSVRPQTPQEESSSPEKSRIHDSDVGDIPHYMLPLDRNLRPESPHEERPHDSRIHESFTDGSEIPHYMLPLDRNLRPHSPYEDTSELSQTPTPMESNESRTSTFGVKLRTTDSGRTVTNKTGTTTTSSQKVPSRSNSPEKPKHRESSPDAGHIPHYMLPLEKCQEPHDSDHKISRPTIQTPTAVESNETKSSKFGVTLRRTDSGRAVITTTTLTSSHERKKSAATSDEYITEEDIEEIYELLLLEELLEKVVSYELRRKIRAQIRLVKKLMSENRLSAHIAKRKSTIVNTKREMSPGKPKSQVAPRADTHKTTEFESRNVRKLSPDRKHADKKTPTDSVEGKHVEKTSEYRFSHSHSDYTTVHRSKSPETKPRKGDMEKTTKVESKEVRKPSPERRLPDKNLPRTDPADRKHTEHSSIHQSSYSYSERRTSSDYTTKSQRTKSPETKPQRGGHGVSTTDGKETHTTKTTETTETSRRPGKTLPVTKTTDEKPEWVRQRNLKKVTDTNPATVTKRTTTTKTSRKENHTNSPVREVKVTDLITSSYGVGPTDENGTPLFGLRALRAQNKTDTTKVQGTVIRSEYYSENGNEPIGEVSVTKYSTDPRDLASGEESVNNKGITSVTTTQKFGYKDTPSLKSITNGKKEITGEETQVSNRTKVARKNSVKALSQKFIDNAVETLKSERQTSYPRAGLILRTSSFKDRNSESDPDDQETSSAFAESETTTRIQTTTTRAVSGDTFLTNKTRVSGMKDVINRMKTEDYQEGDTEEDSKARGLLNKFIGSQVILSGMESREGTSQTTSGTLKKTIKVTTTITEGGKPTTRTLVFQSPVTEEELENIWDEQTLRLLLEQSTDYEERRIVRTRLRKIMAEQEACTELVEKASQDQSSGLTEESISTKNIVSEGPLTTTSTQVTKVTTRQELSKKPLSPFAKFRQLDKQNSVNTPPRTSN